MAKKRIAYSYKDLAEITPYAARTWRWRVAQGKIRAVKDGNKAVVILHKDLEAYYESLPEARQEKAQSSQVDTVQVPA